MQDVREQKNKLNKGFSLVELIVVIAIMAILVGVIATTFVRYVAKSQTTANDSNVKILKGAVEVALTDPDLGDLGDLKDATFVIPWEDGKMGTINNGVGDSFRTCLEASLDKTKDADGDSVAVYPAPSSGDGSFTITVSGTAATGYTSTVTFEPAKAADADDDTTVD